MRPSKTLVFQPFMCPLGFVGSAGGHAKKWSDLKKLVNLKHREAMARTRPRQSVETARECFALFGAASYVGTMHEQLDQITIKLPTAIRTALASAAQAQRRTVSNMARLLLEQGLEQQTGHGNGATEPAARLG